jgi:hypothetical protein
MTATEKRAGGTSPEKANKPEKDQLEISGMGFTGISIPHPAVLIYEPDL